MTVFFNNDANQGIYGLDSNASSSSEQFYHMVQQQQQQHQQQQQQQQHQHQQHQQQTQVQNQLPNQGLQPQQPMNIPYPSPFSQCHSPIMSHHLHPSQHSNRAQDNFNFASNMSPLSATNTQLPTAGNTNTNSPPFQTPSSSLMTSPITRKSNTTSTNPQMNMNLQVPMINTPDSFRNFPTSKPSTTLSDTSSFASPANFSNLTSSNLHSSSKTTSTKSKKATVTTSAAPSNIKTRIYKINSNDVLSGNFRKGISGQEGNKQFRKLVNTSAHLLHNDTTDSIVSRECAKEIIKTIANLEPSGRFLKFEGMEDFDIVQERSFSSIDRNLDINSFSKYHSDGKIPVFTIATEVESLKKTMVAIRDKRNSIKKKEIKEQQQQQQPSEEKLSNTESEKPKSKSHTQTPSLNQMNDAPYAPRFTPSPFPYSIFSPNTPQSYSQYHPSKMSQNKDGPSSTDFFPNANLFPTPLKGNQTEQGYKHEQRETQPKQSLKPKEEDQNDVKADMVLKKDIAMKPTKKKKMKKISMKEEKSTNAKRTKKESNVKTSKKRNDKEIQQTVEEPKKRLKLTQKQRFLHLLHFRFDVANTTMGIDPHTFAKKLEHFFIENRFGKMNAKKSTDEVLLAQKEIEIQKLKQTMKEAMQAYLAYCKRPENRSLDKVK